MSLLLKTYGMNLPNTFPNNIPIGLRKNKQEKNDLLSKSII